MIHTAIGKFPDPMERFFRFARERHNIYLKRQAGVDAPWTEDEILARYRFTNVFRELDATTVWCRKYVREPLHGRPAELLLAVILFRWFNRITTGETLFTQLDIEDGRSVFERHLQALSGSGPTAAISVLRSALRQQPPPHVTGAYTINTAGLGTGKSKVEGVLAQYRTVLERDWRVRGERMALPQFGHSGEGTCTWLRESPGLGGFMAYEIVCDLYHTPLLNHAKDRWTWAHAGPGAQRGLNRVFREVTDIVDVRRPVKEEKAIEEMQELRRRARTVAGLWPQGDSVHWPEWDMRTVEHTLCEFDKYERTRLGQGRPRGVFSHG